MPSLPVQRCIAASTGTAPLAASSSTVAAAIPVGRLGAASEIARGVVFLTADDAGFITGSTLSINGGQHMY